MRGGEAGVTDASAAAVFVDVDDEEMEDVTRVVCRLLEHDFFGRFFFVFSFCLFFSQDVEGLFSESNISLSNLSE